MDIEVLGRPAIRVGGERVALTGRQPALLAALVIASPRPVAAGALLAAVWGDRLPRDPANALQQRVSALRQLLGRAGGGDALATVSGGYALRITDDDVDAGRFARDAAAARELLARDELGAAVERFDLALARWQGEAFEGLGDEPWLTPEIQRLHELRAPRAAVGGAGGSHRGTAAAWRGAGPGPRAVGTRRGGAPAGTGPWTADACALPGRSPGRGAG